MDVDNGSPAEEIGLQAGQLSVTIEGEPWVLGGDILTAVNGQTVTNTEQYTKVLQALQADQMIEMPVFKDGAYHAMSVKLGERLTAPNPQHRPRIQVLRLSRKVLRPPAFDSHEAGSSSSRARTTVERQKTGLAQRVSHLTMAEPQS
jgi:hypothetical protein